MPRDTLPQQPQERADATATSPQGFRKTFASRVFTDSGSGDSGHVRSDASSPPDSRTRSIWLTQLVLAATVVIICALAIAIQPQLFSRWTLGTGILLLILVTMATLAAPWERLSRGVVVAVPMLDAVAIGLMASGSELRLSYLWVFPVMWAAIHFSVRALASMLGLILVMVVMDAALSPSQGAVMRLFVVVLSLSFIAITAHLAVRQSRALRTLLQRQAARLNRTVDRRSEQERRTTEILNDIDIGVARISLAGSVLAVNTTYATLFGIDPLDDTLPAKAVEYNDYQGMPVPVPDRPFSRASRGEVFADLRTWLYTAAGEWRVLSSSARTVDGTSTDDTTMLLIVHDVTAITHAQRERERLTAIVSHELKHPLTVMISTADLALESDELTPRVRERIETMLQASERMLTMTSSMLSPSRKTFAGGDTHETIDVRRMLWDSTDSFGPSAASHEVALEVTTEEQLPVSADGFRLRQVVDNLVSNAIKYTPGGGTVRVTGRIDEGIVSIVVADNGIGISRADLPRITTPYFRTEDAKGKAGGTGLGLSIANEIITAHKGSLTISSAPGAGTSVEVRLPRAHADTTTLEAER